ncbi:MAG: FkbM family methyltransferase [Lentisphaerae bacterium]|nr:FkbM family methyltransferase [Lentisphaerota bacterium]
MSSNDYPLTTFLADHSIRPIFRLPVFEDWLFWLADRTGIQALFKCAPAHYSYSPGTIRRCTRHGIHFELDISTYHGWMIYYRRSGNRRVSDLVNRGDTVMDVGANIGEVTLLCAQKTGPDGLVIAFEPNPATFAQLSKMLALNPGLNCVLVNQALGSMTGPVTMVQPDNRNPGTCTIASSTTPGKALSANIPLTTLDQYIEEHPISRLNLIKLDVEGYELNVLQGAEKTISRYRPVLVIELVDSHQKRHGHSAADIVKFVLQHDYRVTDFSGQTPFGIHDHFEDCSLDITCVPNECVSR